VGQSEHINSRCVVIGYCVLRLWNAAALTVSKSNAVEGWDEILVETLIKTENYDKAITVLEELAAKTPQESPWIIQNLAPLYRSNGQLDKAINQFKNCKGSDSSVNVPLRLGEAFSVHGDHEGAIDYYSKMVCGRRSQWWEWQFLAEAYIGLQNVVGGLDVYDRAIEEKGCTAKWALAAKSFLVSTTSESGSDDTTKLGDKPSQSHI